MSSTIPYTPSISSAPGDALLSNPPVQTDDQNWLLHDPGRWDAKYGSNVVFSQLMALINAGIAPSNFGGIPYICLAGLNVGDPVQLTGNNTVSLALSTAGNNTVIGFVRSKPTATSCYIVFYYRVIGTFTANQIVYLTNAGGYSNSPGTISTPLGVAISATEALVAASPNPTTATQGLQGMTGVAGVTGFWGLWEQPVRVPLQFQEQLV